MGAKSPSTYTIIFYTVQHTLQCTVQWQFGSVIEDNTYMGAVAREFSYVLHMADTSSLISRGGWGQFASLLHKCSNAFYGGQEGASTCVCNIKVHIWIH